MRVPYLLVNFVPMQLITILTIWSRLLTSSGKDKSLMICRDGIAAINTPSQSTAKVQDSSNCTTRGWPS